MAGILEFAFFTMALDAKHLALRGPPERDGNTMIFLEQARRSAALAAAFGLCDFRARGLEKCDHAGQSEARKPFPSISHQVLPLANVQVCSKAL